MIKSVRIFWLLLAGLQAFSVCAQQQQDTPCFRWERGYKATFEPPKLAPIPKEFKREEWKEEIKRQTQSLNECKRDYALAGYNLVEKLHQSFRVLSDPGKARRIKKAAKSVGLALFKDKDGQTTQNVRYLGFVLDKNNEFTVQSRNLEVYMDALIARDTIKFRVDTIYQNGKRILDTVNVSELYNICWGIPPWETTDKSDSVTYAVDFKKEGFSTPILKSPIDKDSTKRSYQVYSAEIPIREVIAFRRSLTYEKAVCKKIHFKLRYVPKIDTSDQNSLYYWQVSLEEMVELDNPDACKTIPDNPCEKDTMTFPDLVITEIDTSSVRDISDCKRLVPLWTYTVPGVGFQSLRERKKGFPAWSLITGAWAGTAAAAVVYKNESNVFYQKHLESTVLRDRDEWFDKAEANNNKFLYYAGASALIWAVTDFVIFAKDGNERRKCRRNFEIFQKQQNSRTSMFMHPTLLNDPFTDKSLPGIRWGLKLH